MRPTDAVALRRVVLETFGHGVMESVLRGYVAAMEGDAIPALTDDLRQAAASEMTSTLGRHLEAAETFWVSKTMADVVEAGARAWPEDATLTSDNLPSGCGFVVFDRPMLLRREERFDLNQALGADVDSVGTADFGFEAMAWGPCANPLDNDKPGIMVVPLLRTEVFVDAVDGTLDTIDTLFGEVEGEDAKILRERQNFLVKVRDRLHTGRASLPLIPVTIGFFTYGASMEDDYLSSVLQALGALMAQSLTVVAEQSADRHERRRWQRAKRPVPAPVRVVDLRRIESAGEPGEPRAVDWSCRWVVRGHWRNQPTREGYKRVWINAFVKGPEGLPLAHGEKVYALRR